MKYVAKAENCVWICAFFLFSFSEVFCRRLSHIYIKAHLRMCTYAKCQVPVPMHKAEAGERLGGCDVGLVCSDLSTYNNVVKKFSKTAIF